MNVKIHSRGVLEVMGFVAVRFLIDLVFLATIRPHSRANRSPFF
ncbi:hypothetical protein [Helicobacter pylori]|nr:hypothetical protein [Helicobacter pylori]